ncbi:hypothetical protein Ancab_039285 [Ancistrocladus abbreviatus]
MGASTESKHVLLIPSNDLSRNVVFDIVPQHQTTCKRINNSFQIPMETGEGEGDAVKIGVTDSPEKVETVDAQLPTPNEGEASGCDEVF